MARVVIVGGGIAGVSCAEELSRLLPDEKITLVSGSLLVKAITNYTKVSRAIEHFDVEEKPVSYLTQICPNVTIHSARVVSISVAGKTVKLSSGDVLKFEKLCLCTGASPAVIVEEHPLVLGIRDIESVQTFKEKLKHAHRIMVVGNGGIATEIVYEVKGCQIIWAIKDHAISHTFFDEGAAAFFLPQLASSEKETAKSSDSGKAEAVVEVSPFKRTKYALEQSPVKNLINEDARCGAEAETMGVALGPDWHSGLEMTGKESQEKQPGYRHVHVEYQTEVKDLLTYQDIEKRNILPSPFPAPNSSLPTANEGTDKCSSPPRESKTWPLYVVLTNGKVFGVDLVVSATGVSPNVGGVEVVGGEVVLDDGGVAVDREMRTSIPDMYAAGDVCTVKWEEHSRVWFQMRLWTQARQLGAYSARCMAAHLANETTSLDFCFEMFAHVTKFFGYKVVLLGLYNAQTLGPQDYEILLRCTKGVEYVKVILQEGKMVGAILIGETDLEETFENLILNQMDLSAYGENLLDPSVDIEDYFD